MDYVDIPFPPRLAFGAERRAGWSTTIVQTIGGAESANQNWARRRHTYDVSFSVRTASDYETIDAHHAMVRGRARVFPFRDPLDYRVVAARSLLVEDETSSDGGYWMAKTYGSGDGIYIRPITRPRTGTVAIYRLRSGVTTAITPNVTIDYATGHVDVVTPGAVVDGDVLSWVGDFWVPCRYDTDELPAVIINKQTGTDGQFWVQCDSIPIFEHKEGPVL